MRYEAFMVSYEAFMVSYEAFMVSYDSLTSYIYLFYYNFCREKIKIINRYFADGHRKVTGERVKVIAI